MRGGRAGLGVQRDDRAVVETGAFAEGGWGCGQGGGVNWLSARGGGGGGRRRRGGWWGGRTGCGGGDGDEGESYEEEEREEEVGSDYHGCFGWASSLDAVISRALSGLVDSEWSGRLRDEPRMRQGRESVFESVTRYLI